MMTQNSEPTIPQGRSSLANGLRIALWAGFAIVGLLTAFLTFRVVRDLVTSWEMTGLPGVTIKDATPTPQGATPGAVLPENQQPAVGPTPVPWSGADRVSLLIMGLDYRDWQAGEGPPRTDSMILLTIDPVNRTAGMLSIPRDLWVSIPGQGYGRINTAYQIGEALKLPGGGPQLAVDTVEELLGVPIEYYAQIDFGAFVRFIDEIGGVKIDVPEKTKISTLTENRVRFIKPGVQTLTGDLALAYVRARKSEGGDFDRAQRQQLLIMAIRERMLEFNALPGLIAKAPVLYDELSTGIHTNLSLDDTIRLAWLAVQIPEDQIKKAAIGADQVSFATSPDGTQEVLKPLTEKIRLLRDEMFTATGPASPIAINLDPAELIKLEAARVTVLNGSTTNGLASRTTEYLIAQGISVTQTGNADQHTPYTQITFYSGKPYTIKFLVDLMAISEFRIRYFFDPASTADIVIIVGDDWAVSGKLP